MFFIWMQQTQFTKNDEIVNKINSSLYWAEPTAHLRSLHKGQHFKFAGVASLWKRQEDLIG